MVHIFYLIGSLQEGGSERQLANLCQSLQSLENTKVFIFNWMGSKEDYFFDQLENLGATVVILSQEGSIIRKIKVIRSLVKRYSPCILHSFSYYLNIIGLLGCVNTSTFAVGSLRSSYHFLSKITPWHHRFLNYFLVKRIISNSHAGLEEMKKALWSPFSRSEIVVPNHFKAEEKSNEQIIRQLERKEFFQSISIGRCDRNKRIDLIIEVIHALLRKGYRVRHYHAGKGEDLADLQEKVKDLELEGIFHFLGTVKPIETILEKADLLIHAAETEGAPNVVMEAMSFGLPVISTKCGDVPQLIKDGTTAILVEVNDKSGLINAYQRVIENKDYAIQLGIRAHRYVIENFSNDTYALTMIKGYQEIGVTCAG